MTAPPEDGNNPAKDEEAIQAAMRGGNDTGSNLKEEVFSSFFLSCAEAFRHRKEGRKFHLIIQGVEKMKERSIRVLVTLKKKYGIDCCDLLYLVGTGRLTGTQQYEINSLLDCNTTKEACEKISYYKNYWSLMLEGTETEELTKKGWISTYTERIAAKIAKMIPSKYKTIPA